MVLIIDIYAARRKPDGARHVQKSSTALFGERILTCVRTNAKTCIRHVQNDGKTTTTYASYIETDTQTGRVVSED